MFDAITEMLIFINIYFIAGHVLDSSVLFYSLIKLCYYIMCHFLYEPFWVVPSNVPLWRSTGPGSFDI